MAICLCICSSSEVCQEVEYMCCGVCFLQWPAQVVLKQACKRISYLCISKRLWGSGSKMATLKNS